MRDFKHTGKFKDTEKSKHTGKIKHTGKQVGKAALFLAILALIFAGLSGLVEAASLKNDTMVQSRNKSLFGIMREPENTIDVLILGDSLSYASVSPMEIWGRYGITSYVCGQSGQTIQESYHMLQKALETQSPKLVILETDNLFKGKSGIKAVQQSLEELGNYYSVLFRCHDIWKSFLVNKSYSTRMYKGFSFRTKVAPVYEGQLYEKD